MIYFDHNATYPISAVAREAWLDSALRYIGNPSSPHRIGDRADHAVTEARERLAEILGCKPAELTWTSGATEATNTALAHLAATRSGELLLSAVEHPSVWACARRYFPGRHRALPVDHCAVLDLGVLRAALSAGKVAAVAIMAANNEVGVLQAWQEAAEICREFGVPFFCDAAQWIGRLPAMGLGACDYVVGCGHKFGGPTGVGFLKAPEDLQPLIVGGPQEEGRRGGTENVAGIIAMMAALQERQSGLAPQSLREAFLTRLGSDLPSVRVIGRRRECLWNTVSVIMPEAKDCRQRWVVKLDKLGFAVSTGSACASGKEQPSHVLTAIGLTPEEAGRVLRFSSGWETSGDDWDALAAALKQAVAELC